MAVTESRSLYTQRRKRRRRQDKPAISARLVLDDHVKGDVGVLSEDLFADLFPSGVAANGTDSSSTDVKYVAISPWAPSNSIDDSTWTVVPVTPSSALAHSTLQFSPSSSALQGFAELLHKISPSKLLSHSRSGIEIRVLDIVPLPLKTVFITLGSELAERLEDGEGTFHGEHPGLNGLKGQKAQTREQRLMAALRESLGALHVVHAGDFVPLPLAPHPITHVPPPPAKVTLCEPVAQGVLSPETVIIVTRSGHRTRKTPSIPLNAINEGDETANDQFYSAAEDRYKTDGAIEDTEDSTLETETETSDAEHDDLSDDSMDELISLQAPLLPASTLSGVSTVQPGSPHTVGLGRRTNGINTPGSVFSTFTNATVRAGGSRGRLFRTQGLTGHIPEVLLHPKPALDEDEEIRIFVDTSSLTKIGCFSGDWVRLETSAAPPAAGIGLWGLGSFGNAEPEEIFWRPAKVYSLPEGYVHRPVSKIQKEQAGGRKFSFFESQVEKPSHSTVFMSPVLLTNLENSSYIRLSPLKAPLQPGRTSQPKMKNSAQPPIAKELVLYKIASPFSTERQMQNILFNRLQRYFRERMRVLRKGDVIGIGVDERLARTMHQVGVKEDPIADDVLSSTKISLGRGPTSTTNTAVAWFLVDYVSSTDVADTEEDVWGGIAAIDASYTRMTQSGTAKMKLPGTVDNNWEYYLGIKAIPKSGHLSATYATLEPRRQHITPLRRRLRELIAAATSPRAIHLKLPPVAILLVSTQRGIGKATLATRASSDLGLHTFSIDAYDILSEGGAGGSDMKTEALLSTRADRAMSCGAEFCSLLIRHIEALTADRMAPALKEILTGCRVLIATTTDVDQVPDAVRALFTHELEMNAPDEWEREGILQGIVDDYGVSLAPDVDLSGVAIKTAALVAGDLVDVVDRALVARSTRLCDLASAESGPDLAITTRDVLISGGVSAKSLTAADFIQAVDAARKNFADSIGAPKIPNVTWDDVGGLSNVKDAVMETIQLPLERPELFAKGMKKRSGILFYGPPGTGKTLLAKAIATEFSLNFFSVKGPELLNMYIGESEANVRRVFQRARDARPCVVFFDELDSVAPKRGNQGDSGGVMDRIVSQLLAELDGMSNGEDGGGGVFVIGATNRPDLLDAALLRPGRFDKMLYLGVSDTHEKQLTIMEALTRKFTMHPSTSLKRVAAHLPFTYTGADFYALCSDAMLKAVTRAASNVDAKIKSINASRPKGQISTAYFFDHFATKDDIQVLVTEQDFLDANRELVPSVSAKELEHYSRVRQQFEAAEAKKTEKTEKPYPNRRTSSGLKGKGRVFSGGKGKGKAREESGEENGYYHSNDDENVSANGSVKGKGKASGEAVDMSFSSGTYEDDEDMYA